MVAYIYINEKEKHDSMKLSEEVDNIKEYIKKDKEIKKEDAKRQ